MRDCVCRLHHWSRAYISGVRRSVPVRSEPTEKGVSRSILERRIDPWEHVGAGLIGVRSGDRRGMERFRIGIRRR